MNERKIAASIAAMETNIGWIKTWMECADKKFAPYWIKYPVYAATGTILLWALDLILDMIPKATALFLNF